MSVTSVVSSPDAPPAIGPYSQGIKAGGFVFLSGQIPLVGPTGKIVSGMVKEQTEQVILNIQALLASEGLTLNDVVKATVFLASMNEFSAMNEIYAKYFTGTPPARSTIEVSRLPRDVRVEIEVIAQLRS
ncbi:MAG TPA: RidA family protein [Candidatus Methylacidiphilales bacterium]|jgi:2-iminobutanoate/2-iminopropanoate deaminase|nr:RidA family protein [Candidatus Methylacidiphilales bacterium]